MMKRLVLSVVGLSLLLFGNVGQVEAMRYDVTDDLRLDVDVELKYIGAWRMKDQDSKLVGVATPDGAGNHNLSGSFNADDGNNSFDDGDMVYNKYSVIADMDIQYKNLGVFIRPRAFYDAAYDGSNANNSLTNNNTSMYGGPLSASDQFMDGTQDRHRDTVEILDLYAYGQFEIVGERNMDLRIGQQVVSWGESVYVQNSISSAMSPIDSTASVAPGVALKEIFLPVEQVYTQIDVTRNINISGYYQWEWEKSRLAEQGSYFSDSDGLDSAGRRYLTGLPGIPGFPNDIAFDKTSREEASDDGQWGVSVRYLAEGLNDTEFGLYYANYHDKYPMVIFEPGTPFYAGSGTYSPTGQFLGAAPVVAGQPTAFGTALGDSVLGGWANAPVFFDGTGGYLPLGAADLTAAGSLNWVDLSTYHLAYAEDIKLIGASFGTSIGDTNVGGEVSYRDGVPIQVKADPNANLLGFSYADGEAVQVQISAMHSIGLTPVWDSLFLKGEVGYNRVSSYGNAELVADEDAWGGTVVAEASYYQVLRGLDMEVSLQYGFNPDGTSSLAASFVEDENSIAYGLDFTYLIDYRFGVEYVDFLGDAEDNSLSDRDYLAATFSYTF